MTSVISILADTAVYQKPIGGLRVIDVFLIIFTILFALSWFGYLASTGSPWEPKTRLGAGVLLVLIICILVFLEVQRHLPQ